MFSEGTFSIIVWLAAGIVVIAIFNALFNYKTVQRLIESIIKRHKNPAHKLWIIILQDILCGLAVLLILTVFVIFIIQLLSL